MTIWRRTLSYFARDRGLVTVVVVVQLGMAAIGLLMAWPMAILIDVVLPQEAPATLLHRLALAVLPRSTEGRIAGLAAALFALKLVQDLAGMIRTRATNRIFYGGLIRVRSHVFRKLQRLRLGYHRAQPPGELLYRLSQDSLGAQGVLNTILTTVVAAVTLLAMIAILGSRSLLLTGLAFATLPALAAANFWFERVLGACAREAKAEDSRLFSLVQRSISIIGLVQAFGRESDEVLRFSRLATSSAGAWQRLAAAEARYWLVVGTVFGVGGAVVFGVGGWLVHTGRGQPGALTVGDLIVFVAYLGLLWDPLCKLTGAGTTMQGSLAGMRRVFEILDREAAVRDDPAAAPLPMQRRTIELRGVEFAHADRPVLRGVDCRIEAGQMVAFVGPSGVGKSSLLNLLPRFDDPTAGQVLFDGRDLRTLRLRDVRRHLAVVLQEPILLPTSIAENIAYGRAGASPEDVRAAGERAGVDEFASVLPGGYDTHLGEGATPLSVGQRQRIAIARALLSEAPVLVLDEPTSALDPENERRVMHLLAGLRGARTIVLVTHRLLALEACDRIHVMRAGRIVESGSFAELLARSGEFARLAREEAVTDGRP